MRRVFFPFTAIVGLENAKLALLAVAIDPTIGGVLLAGDKGTGKSTLVRALAQVLPNIPVVKGCIFNCNPFNPAEMCDKHYELWVRGKELEVEYKPMRIIDLPLSVTPDRLVGSIDVERTIKEGKVVFKPGLLAEANRNILYVDEVNLLEDYIADLLLDAAASGWNIVEREGISFKHPARFILVGTMNPEEGELRPQILDRFGLFVDVSASMKLEDRIEIVLRVEEFHKDPLGFYEKYRSSEEGLRAKIMKAKELLPNVVIDRDLLKLVADTVIKLGIRTHRAEITVVKTAKALAALDGRTKVLLGDIKKAMELALPHRIKSKPFEEPKRRLEEVMKDVFGGSNSVGEGGSKGGVKGGEGGISAGGAVGTRGSGSKITLSKFMNYDEVPLNLNLSNDLRRSNYGEELRGRASRSSFITEVGSGRGFPIDAIPPLRSGEFRDIDLATSVRYAVIRTKEAPIRVSSEDLRVRVRRVPTSLLHVILLDASSSMLASERVRVAKSIVRELAKRSYLDRAYVSVITFRGRDAELILKPTRLYELALKAVNEVVIGGSTPLAIGLVKSLNVIKSFLMKNRGSKAVLHLITDGRANVPLSSNLIDELIELGNTYSKLGINVVTYLVRERSSLDIGINAAKVFTQASGGKVIDILGSSRCLS